MIDRIGLTLAAHAAAEALRQCAMWSRRARQFSGSDPNLTIWCAVIATRWWERREAIQRAVADGSVNVLRWLLAFGGFS